jgi:hypothetical protein
MMDYGARSPEGVWMSDVRAQGLYVCAPGYSGDECDTPFCEGEVNISWPTASISSHANHSQPYRDQLQCRWLYDTTASAANQRVTVNITSLDLEYEHDYLEIECLGVSANFSSTHIGRFTGYAPCPLRSVCMQEEGGAKQYWRGSGKEEGSEEADMCQTQRDWSWLAVQVDSSTCSLLAMKFYSDASKVASGFSARVSRGGQRVLRPFIEATITFFNHTIADMHSKTEGVLKAVARAAQVPQRDVVMSHVVGHLDTRADAQGGAGAVKVGAEQRVGRRPVDEADQHAHQHVTVTIKVLIHKTDAPEPQTWAVYHRLAYQKSPPAPPCNLSGLSSPLGPPSVLPRRHADAQNVGLEQEWEKRRTSVDDTLWIWGLDPAQLQQAGIWKESDGEGTAIIQVCTKEGVCTR